MDKLPAVERLPVEVLDMIFKFLSIPGRKAGLMVNSTWRKAGEASYLWAWVQLPVVRNQNSRARVIDMLRCERLARVEEITIEAHAVSEELLQALINHEGLKRIELRWPELTAGLNPQLVVEALTRVETLQLSVCSLPTHLLDALLTKVSQGGSNLKELGICNAHLADVPAALAASALTRLVTVYLSGKLTSAHVAALMEAIDQGSSIKKLTLKCDFPEEDDRTEPLDLKPLVNLEEVELRYFLTQQELVDFFAALSNSTNLRVFKCPIKSFWPAEEVMDGSTEMMARAINFLEEVDMLAHIYQVCRLQSSSPHQKNITKLNFRSTPSCPGASKPQSFKMSG